MSTKRRRRRVDASAFSTYRRFNLLRRMATRPRFKLLGASIEQQTLSQSVFGASRLWRVVGYYVVFRVVARRILGKQPQRVAVDRLRIDQGLTIRLLPPSARSR